FGRFLTADPITSSPLTTQGNNRYAYVDNDPINLTDPSGFAPSGGFFDGWPSPYTEIVTGAYTAAWVGLATYAVIDALGGASAGATAGGAAVATPTTSTLSAEFVVVGKNVGKAPGGAASIGLGIGSGIQILDAANLPLPKPAVPARSPTPGQAPTGNAKGQSLGRVGPGRSEILSRRGGAGPTPSVRYGQARVDAAYRSLEVRWAKGPVYDQVLADYGQTTATGVRIGSPALQSEGMLRSTIVHENVHVRQLRSGNYPHWRSDVAAYVSEAEAYRE